MKNGLFKLYKNDFVNTLVMAVLATILLLAYNLVTKADFDLFKVEWIPFFKDMANGVAITVVTYLVKNLLTTNKGSVLNITPEAPKNIEG